MVFTQAKQGFTLVELLVVVLIIGILAAVALPQYQKAVEKARAAQVLPLLNALYKADVTYQLANGKQATSFDELDVDIPWSGNTKWYDTSVITDTKSNGDWSAQLEKNEGGYDTVFMGRLSGPYRGGGFAYYTKAANTDFPLNKLLCVEKVATGVNFTGDRGDYCEKLFHATFAAQNSGWGRVYLMP